MDRDLEVQLTTQLAEALRGFNAYVHPFDIGLPDGGINVRIDVELPNMTSFSLAVAIKTTLYPRDVRDVLWQLRHFRNSLNKDDQKRTVPLIAATVISSGAKDILKEENVGYFDSGGSLFIPAHGVYVLIDRPAPKSLKRTVLALFRGKRSQIVHALLHRPGHWFGVAEIADLARVSPTTASETLTELERLEWIEARGNGPAKERRVANPVQLLDRWAKFIQSDHKAKLRRFYVPTTNTNDIARRLAHICGERHIDYALTQEFAAQLIAPFLTNVARVACYLPSSRGADFTIPGLLGASPVNEGYNLTIFDTEPGSEQLFRERHNNFWLASPIIIYLDLLRGEGRAKELAQHLRTDCIGF